MEEPMVLGQTWCYQFNYQVGWHTRQAKLMNKGQVSYVPLRQEVCTTSRIGEKAPKVQNQIANSSNKASLGGRDATRHGKKAGSS